MTSLSAISRENCKKMIKSKIYEMDRDARIVESHNNKEILLKVTRGSAITGI